MHLRQGQAELCMTTEDTWPPLLDVSLDSRCCPAAGLLFRMPLARLSPDVVSFNAAITACEQGSQWQLALSILTLGEELHQKCNR